MTATGTVTILQLAGSLGHNPQTVSDALAGEVVRDPITGLACVPHDVAASYAAGRRAADHRHDVEQAGYKAYLTDRGVRRMEVVHAARVAARQAVLDRNRIALHSTTGPGLAMGPVLRAGMVGSDIEYACREAEFNAGNVAWAEFERREPEMTFDRWIAKHGKAIAEALAA